MIKTTATITELHYSASGEVVFVLLRPQETFSFLEGQFMMIETDCFGTSVKRPYSIATTSQQLQDYKQVGFYVKKASDKGLSAWFTTQATIGDTVSLQGPVGHYFDSNDHTQYLFIATGSGLSPNLGLFQHLVYESKKHSRIVHIFGEKKKDDLVPAVQTIITSHGDKSVESITTLSREKSTEYKNGRVQQHIDEVLKKFDDLHISVFLCGAPAMVKEVELLLIEKGIEKEYITTEKR